MPIFLNNEIVIFCDENTGVLIASRKFSENSQIPTSAIACSADITSHNTEIKPFLPSGKSLMMMQNAQFIHAYIAYLHEFNDCNHQTNTRNAFSPTSARIVHIQRIMEGKVCVCLFIFFALFVYSRKL